MTQDSNTQIAKITSSKLRKDWRALIDNTKRNELSLVITQYGDPVAVLIGVEDFQRLTNSSIDIDKILEWER